MEKQQQWRKLCGEKIRRPMQDEIMEVIAKERAMGNELKVCIGTDSQVKARPNGSSGRGKQTEKLASKYCWLFLLLV